MHFISILVLLIIDYLGSIDTIEFHEIQEDSDHLNNINEESSKHKKPSGDFKCLNYGIYDESYGRKKRELIHVVSVKSKNIAETAHISIHNKKNKESISMNENKTINKVSSFTENNDFKSITDVFMPISEEALNRMSDFNNRKKLFYEFDDRNNCKPSNNDIYTNDNNFDFFDTTYEYKRIQDNISNKQEEKYTEFSKNLYNFWCRGTDFERYDEFSNLEIKNNDVQDQQINEYVKNHIKNINTNHSSKKDNTQIEKKNQNSNVNCIKCLNINRNCVQQKTQLLNKNNIPVLNDFCISSVKNLGSKSTTKLIKSNLHVVKNNSPQVKVLPKENIKKNNVSLNNQILSCEYLNTKHPKNVQKKSTFIPLEYQKNTAENRIKQNILALTNNIILETIRESRLHESNKIKYNLDNNFIVRKIADEVKIQSNNLDKLRNNSEFIAPIQNIDNQHSSPTCRSKILIGKICGVKRPVEDILFLSKNDKKQKIGSKTDFIISMIDSVELFNNLAKYSSQDLKFKQEDFNNNFDDKFLSFIKRIFILCKKIDILKSSCNKNEKCKNLEIKLNEFFLKRIWNILSKIKNTEILIFFLPEYKNFNEKDSIDNHFKEKVNYTILTKDQFEIYKEWYSFLNDLIAHESILKSQNLDIEKFFCLIRNSLRKIMLEGLNFIWDKNFYKVYNGLILKSYSESVKDVYKMYDLENKSFIYIDIKKFSNLLLKTIFLCKKQKTMKNNKDLSFSIEEILLCVEKNNFESLINAKNIDDLLKKNNY